MSAGFFTSAIIIFGLVVDFVFRVIAIIVVPRNRRPSSATAWLLAINFLPYIGLLVFLLIGSYKLPKHRRAKQAQINQFILDQTEGMERVRRDHPWPTWLEQVVALNRNLGAMPRGMFSGPAFGYDPDTHTLHHIGDENYMYHMISVFGGAEVAFELAELIDEPGWTRAWLEFCELYNAPPDVAGRRPKDRAKTAYPVWHARLTARAAKQKGDAVLARRAWDELLYAEHRTPEQRYPLQPRAVRGPEALNPGEELPWLETNHASQWSLNAIELLALVPEALPERLGGAWE